jgi:sortase (surface protein transpeptidase)
VVSNNKNLRRQPAKSRLSSGNVGTVKRGRRAHHLSLKLGSIKYDISLRRFKTSKSARTKLKKQLVISLLFLPVREIAITKNKGRPLKNQWWTKLAVSAPFAFGLAGLIFFSLHVSVRPDLNVASSGKVKAASITVPVAKSYPRSLPSELKIPKIDVDSAVQPISLNADGSLAVPSDFHATGWFSGSPTPGEVGASVIDGHVDNVSGIGVFWRLREMAAGDTFQVVRADGSAINFKVTSIQQFPQDQFPTNEVYGKVNYAGLRLITCGGIFNTSTGHYSDNIVVFAQAL